MADWTNPTGFQLEALHEALLFAYPSPADLNLLLVLKLNTTYAEIAPHGESYRNALLTILVQARGEGWLERLVREALRHRPRSPKLLSLDRSFEITAADVAPALQRSLEDIVRVESGYEDLIPWVQKLETCAWRVCRIEYPPLTARGTGWLVGHDLLLTNWHVVNRALPGGDRDPKEFVCRFDYAAKTQGTNSGTDVRLANDWFVDGLPPSPSELESGTEEPSAKTLDFALVRLARSIGNEITTDGVKRGWVKIAKDQAVPKEKEILFIVQHPAGLPVKMAVGDVESSSQQRARIYHTANTADGSSGSLVLNVKLEAVALHHAGDTLYHQGKIGKPEKNQAIPIGLIADRLIEAGHLSP